MQHIQRLPAEWAPQSGVMLAWPHEETDWAETLAAVEPTYVEIARQIARRELVMIVCADDTHLRRVYRRLGAEAVDLAAVRLTVAPVNDTWIRDYGPLTVSSNDAPRLLDFRFNAWGGKYPASRDDALTCALHGKGAFGDIVLERLSLVLEGGSIDVDGEGCMLTTRACLLSPTRNPDFSQSALEARFNEQLGIEQVLWLTHGQLAGDDTDSHIDMLARFCDPATIAYTACDDPNDPHYAPLKAMAVELAAFRTFEKQPYRLIPLPLPAPIISADGQRLPASYSNFLIINDAVLLPIYDDPADEIARQRLAAAFPTREIVCIDCTALIQQYGSLHCMTMQLPASVHLRSDESDASGTGTTRQRP
ncbi:MAG: agmatine deiminase family protein [Gammaproteobacteria bacterium]|nr:agmatine deiminase family protein [Gammaproteobacteria bacterium]